MQKQMNKTRASLHNSIHHLVFGLKNYLMDSVFTKNVLFKINKLSISHYQDSIQVFSLFHLSFVFTMIFSFLIIGFLLMPAFAISYKLFVITVFIHVNFRFLGLLMQIPSLSEAKLVFDDLKLINLIVPSNGEGDTTTLVYDKDQYIKIINMKFSYNDQNGHAGFSVGPVSFSIKPGKVIFISGPNGGGKTTLAKLISGLYTPQQGSVSLGNKSIAEFRNCYRQLFSVIFDDTSVIDQNLYFPDRKSKDRANDLLDQLNLTSQIDLNDGCFSTTSLSKGQLKRLALVAAYAKDRPIYLFDEWAAEQDPGFRRWFYYDFIAKLKECNKAVIVITHDDRFFHLADSHLYIDCGVVEYKDPA